MRKQPSTCRDPSPTGPESRSSRCNLPSYQKERGGGGEEALPLTVFAQNLAWLAWKRGRQQTSPRKVPKSDAGPVGKERTSHYKVWALNTESPTYCPAVLALPPTIAGYLNGTETPRPLGSDPGSPLASSATASWLGKS
ncbi:hypothetical protein PDE_01091 [Penicillium oxalicum 114-2]|uniref:Uncharacterized protein n=1 Tax=Penicillium oxalicum (strain 114-2 / CGMCC 5302) TaxID=933388 RepID=S7Z6H1_PENO1|nr:hypothetical protein PDE_01091 [Penicillium oxalicum 114-2]